MYKKQFLLATKDISSVPDMKIDFVGDYRLQYHKDLKYTKVKEGLKEIILLGELFCYKTPELTNIDILNLLFKSSSLEVFLINISEYYGEYVLIYKDEKQFVVFNDACGQREVLYNKKFDAFASQLQILKHVEVLDNIGSKYFYESDKFLAKKLFIHDTTCVNAVKRLKPNHYLNINAKEVVRFFPLKKIELQSVDEVAKKAVEILKGYLKAISLRYKLLLPVTAGYDSRVLFLASLDLECRYFVSKHIGMSDSHHDLIISKRLTSICDKEIRVLRDNAKNNNDYSLDYQKGIDFPRFINYNDELVNNDVAIINGNISEIARNYFGYFKSVSGKDLNFLNGLPIDAFVVKTYQNWIETNKLHFKKFGYNLLDMFYWEEKMGVWGAKSKTEANALGINKMSPFNSRLLLNLLLSVDRKYRDGLENVLYDKMIKILSKSNREILSLPINPSKGREKLLKLKKIKLLHYYLFLRMKYKIAFKS